jgi:hypothetical protein
LNDREKEKFKEYREKQIKMKDESKKKRELLEERRKEEEDNLLKEKDYANIQTELEDKNKIISKLKDKVIMLQMEVKDYKYENERDRSDFTETIKDLIKENKLYNGMLKIILSDNEIKKIIELSKYNEDNEEWYIQPFNFKEKNLKLPTIKKHQSKINIFIYLFIN